MDKRKKKSLKLVFVIYNIPCLIIAMAGILLIGHGTNYLQEWYTQTHSVESSGEAARISVEFIDGVYNVVSHNLGRNNTIAYFIISNAQVILMPLWLFFCVFLTGVLFYGIELKKPIRDLMDASEKISNNQLDFEITAKKNNEIGDLCEAFEKMRSALYMNNREMWVSLEERKRLNSAFSHDLRTPLTVLKGYVDLLKQYVPEGKISDEKLLSVLSMMNGQIVRLEHYTQKMSSIHKLEDIAPDIQLFSVSELLEKFENTGKMICGEKEFSIEAKAESDEVNIDYELIMQVYENLISNAGRYAEKRVKVKCHIAEKKLKIEVSDDGKGFSEEALKKASEPFFRDEKSSELHFGLGLYICKIICEKCSGRLEIANNRGGTVTAEIFCENR